MRNRTARHAFAEIMILAVLIAAGAAAGCSDDGGGGDRVQKFPEIEVSPAEICFGSLTLSTCAVAIDAAQLLPGETAVANVRLTNPGQRDLLVSAVTLAYVPPAGATETVPALALQLPPAWDATLAADGAWSVPPVDEADDDSGSYLNVGVVYSRPADDAERTATLRIESDATNRPVLTVAVTVRKGVPSIQLSPDYLDYAVVPIGEVKQKKVTILNTGGEDLVISRLEFTGPDTFAASLQGTEYVAGGNAVAQYDLADPVVLAPQSSTYTTISFSPQDDSAAEAELVFVTNDPDTAGRATVTLIGNMHVPCIAVNPADIHFGYRQPGEIAPTPLEILNCGELPLEIYGIAVAQSPSKFGVDLSGLAALPSPESPLEIPAGDTVALNVTYFSEEPSPLDASGNIILDTGTLVIDNNAFEGQKQVSLQAGCTPQLCPTAFIKCQEGDEVIPQTVLHLIGDESFAPQGAIAKWAWEVTQPQGSKSVFLPSSTFPNPTFEANVAGLYRFQLTVFDQYGTPSCAPAVYEVIVISKNAIHVELLWDTPEDPDETDSGPEAGSDLDLHFLHPYASGPDVDLDGSPDGWFDMPFDCFWFNAHPNWGSYSTAGDDDPGLDRDDTDGAGPENMNLDTAENGAVYRVGVHYWNDHGYGGSFATVRIYVYGQLVFEMTQIPMQHLDMWEVATIEWPSAKVQMVTAADGSPKITPDYENPFFFQP